MAVALACMLQQLQLARALAALQRTLVLNGAGWVRVQAPRWSCS